MPPLTISLLTTIIVFILGGLAGFTLCALLSAHHIATARKELDRRNEMVRDFAARIKELERTLAPSQAASTFYLRMPPHRWRE